MVAYGLVGGQWKQMLSYKGPCGCSKTATKKSGNEVTFRCDGSFTTKCATVRPLGGGGGGAPAPAPEAAGDGGGGGGESGGGDAGGEEGGGGSDFASIAAVRGMSYYDPYMPHVASIDENYTFNRLNMYDYFTGVGAGYQGYTKFVKPKPKSTPASRSSSTGGGVGGQGKVGGQAQKKVIQKEGGSQKAAEDRAAKKRAVAAKQTFAQIWSKLTPQQKRVVLDSWKRYIRAKVAYRIAQINALRRQRGLQPYIPRTAARPGIQTVQFGLGGGIGGSGIGLEVSVQDATAARLAQQFKDADTPEERQKVIEQIITGETSKTLTNMTAMGGGPKLGDPQMRALYKQAPA